jgi:hypothetical protein
MINISLPKAFKPHRMRSKLGFVFFFSLLLGSFSAKCQEKSLQPADKKYSIVQTNIGKNNVSYTLNLSEYSKEEVNLIMQELFKGSKVIVVSVPDEKGLVQISRNKKVDESAFFKEIETSISNFNQANETKPSTNKYTTTGNGRK